MTFEAEPMISPVFDSGAETITWKPSPGSTLNARRVYWPSALMSASSRKTVAYEGSVALSVASRYMSAAP